MLDHDALWRAGGAGGVDDIGRVARIEVERRRGVGLARDRRPVGVEPHELRGSRIGGQPVEQRRLRHQHRAPASASMKASRSRG